MSEIQTSANGTTWAKATIAGTLAETVIAMSYDGSRWVFATSTAKTFYSDNDGASWTQGGDLPGDTFETVKIYYCAAIGIWIALADDAIASSSDGTSWTLRQATGNDQMYDVTDDGTTLVAVGQDGRIYTSANGTAWTLRTPANSYGGDFHAITYAEGLFVAVGENGGGDDAVIQTSPDGTTWTERLNVTGADPVMVLHDGTQFLCYIRTDPGINNIYTSADGTSWSATDTTSWGSWGDGAEFPSFPYSSYYIGTAVYDPGGPDEQRIFIGIPTSNDALPIFQSEDGINFTATSMSNPGLGGFGGWLAGVLVPQT